tara:strand:- start:11 stop:274 length:264 start_codon:yes stop_codon:yes gene_type:complete
MKKRTRSILQELNTVGRSQKHNDHLIEATGNNIIESAINLLNRIAETYDDTTANELERRFLNSIRTGDPRKFKRTMSKVMESKNEDK